MPAATPTTPSDQRHVDRTVGRGWTLDRDAATAAHTQIEDRLAARILRGRLSAGERLPAERDLAQAFGVSRMTVRQALQSLAARGMVARGVGRGTFVAHGKLDHDLTRVAGFSEQMARLGLAAGARLMHSGQQPAPADVAARLALPDGAPAIRIERIRLGGGVPLALEESWLPARRFPGFTDHDVTRSLYALMRDVYGLEPVRAVEHLEPGVADARDAAALEIATGAPLMLVERIAHAADGTPVELARDRFRGDRARFVVEVPARVLADA